MTRQVPTSYLMQALHAVGAACHEGLHRHHPEAQGPPRHEQHPVVVRRQERRDVALVDARPQQLLRFRQSQRVSDETRRWVVVRRQECCHVALVDSQTQQFLQLRQSCRVRKACGTGMLSGTRNAKQCAPAMGVASWRRRASLLAVLSYIVRTFNPFRFCRSFSFI